MKTKILLLSEATLKELTVVDPNIDSKYLQQAIWTVQEEQIHPALGTKLYKRLLDGIEKENLKDEELELIDEHITNAMVFYVQAELPTIVGFKTTNRNLLKQNVEGSEAASMSEMAFIMNRHKSKAETFMDRMKRFLIAQSQEGKFTEYTNPDTKADSLIPKRRSYKCAFVLDDDSDITFNDGYEKPITYLRR